MKTYKYVLLAGVENKRTNSATVDLSVTGTLEATHVVRQLVGGCEAVCWTPDDRRFF